MDGVEAEAAAGTGGGPQEDGARTGTATGTGTAADLTPRQAAVRAAVQNCLATGVMDAAAVRHPLMAAFAELAAPGVNWDLTAAALLGARELEAASGGGSTVE